MNSLRRLDIKYVKGIGPQRAELLTKQLDIRTAYDLVHHFPTSYLDRTSIYTIRELAGEMPYVQLKGRFISFNVLGEGAKTRLTAMFSDGSGTIEVTWFQGIKRLREVLRTGVEYIIFGKPSTFNGRWQMTHPEIDTIEKAVSQQGMRGVYPLTETLRNRYITSRQIHTWICDLLDSRPAFAETLPRSVIEDCRLVSLDTAIRELHRPTTPSALQKARERMKFEELFYIQTDMLIRSRRRKGLTEGFRFARVGKYFNDFYSTCLPFDLTGAQKRVIKEIRADVNTGRQMNRLVQGDVGSGKTLVALMTMLLAVDNGYQACMMAPTEILAGQHYETIRSLAAQIGINVRLLTGSTRAKERREIHAQLLDGSLHILIGTHAVLEDPVQFHNLGFAVIDEQHRFGVRQREVLAEKGSNPHVLVMSATPIPRTLAIILYGDLQVSVIDELPANRLPIKNCVVGTSYRPKAYQFIEKEVRAGRQAYVICPMVEEGEMEDLENVSEYAQKLRAALPADMQVATLHGKMKAADKNRVMEEYAAHNIDVLVSTTVIEVGINVPNATVMMVENAERFGLAQLHQLRGRVGRGEHQSYCIFISAQDSKDTMERLDILNRSNDGFYIASEDLKLRGPGDLFGIRQSGAFAFRMGDIYTDAEILKQASQAVDRVRAAMGGNAGEENVPNGNGPEREYGELIEYLHRETRLQVDFRSI